MKWILLLFPLYAWSAPLDISDSGCPSQIIDLASGQLICVRPQPPAPDPGPPPPPPPVASCSEGPRLNNLGAVVILNGQRTMFSDCGEPTQLRSPSPSSFFWHTGGGGTTLQGSTYSMCVLPGSFESWRYPGGNVTISTNDQRIVFNTSISGNLVVNGSRQRINMINGHSVMGDVTCGPNARDVQFNGQCVCD